MICRQVGDHRLRYFQIARLAGVGEGRRALLSADRSVCSVGRISREAVHCLLCNSIGHIGRQACCCHLPAILQLEGRYAVREGHSAVGPVDRSVAQRYSELELNVLIRCCIGVHRLAHFQVAHFAGVGEFRFAQGRADRSGVTGMSGQRKACRRRFSDGVGNAGRQTGDCLTLAALQGDSTHAVCELDFAERTVDGRIAKGYGKRKLRIRIRCRIGNDGLAQLQIADIPGVSECCRCLGFADGTFVTGRLSCKTICGCFNHFIRHTSRQAGRSGLAAILQREGCNTVRKGHVPEGSVDGSITQSYSEAEVFCFIGSHIRADRLGHFQVAGITGIGEGQRVILCRTDFCSQAPTLFFRNCHSHGLAACGLRIIRYAVHRAGFCNRIGIGSGCGKGKRSKGRGVVFIRNRLIHNSGLRSIPICLYAEFIFPLGGRCNSGRYAQNFLDRE